MAAPAPSSVSEACRAVAQFLAANLQVGDAAVRVTLGTPAEAAPGEQDSEHRINLFFYRFEPIGFGPDRLPGETWYLRAYCLVTPFARLEDGVSAGEGDLRLLGEVVRIFHENPAQTVDISVYEDEGSEPVAGSFHIETVYEPLSPEAINQLWSTQGDVVYRPSLAYELALAPVLPRPPAPQSPLVGATGLNVGGGRRDAPFQGNTRPPVVFPARVDTVPEDWAPRACFVHAGICAESLAFELGSPDLAAFVPSVLVAGEPGAEVVLRWSLWDRASGWRPVGPQTSVLIGGVEIDPQAPDPAAIHTLDLPLDSPGQALLYAERAYERGVDGARLRVRSNPLLVSLYVGTSA